MMPPIAIIILISNIIAFACGYMLACFMFQEPPDDF